MNKPIKKFAKFTVKTPNQPANQPAGMSGTFVKTQISMHKGAVNKPALAQTNHQGGTTQFNAVMSSFPPPVYCVPQTAEQVPPQESPRAPLMRIAGIPMKAENQSAQKTGFLEKVPNGRMAVSLEKAIEGTIDDIKEQLQNYLEVCDTLSHHSFSYDNLIELLFVFVRSVNLDFFVFLQVPKSGDGFSPVFSRGLKNPPGRHIISSLGKAILEKKLSWAELMKIVSVKDGSFADYVAKEKIESVGFVPFHDGKAIRGLMIIGSYSKKQKSPIASQLLELCGGRIGISLSLKAKDEPFSPKILTLMSGIKETQKQAMEYLELIMATTGARDDLAGKILIKCKNAVEKNCESIETLSNEIKAGD
jgi:hypothetical protein